MEEIWKDIAGYEGLYQVSNLGNVKNYLNNKILKTSSNGLGYLKLVLCKNKNKRTFYVHRLVMLAFVGFDKSKQVNHIDRNKLNNKLDNLEYVTARENMSYIRTDKPVGVYKRKDTSKYRSKIYFNGKTINIGDFKTQELAIKAYNEKLKELNISNKYSNGF